jgi:hypothetical protein
MAAMTTAVETKQLPPEANETAKFVGELNDLFDCLNSRMRIDPNPNKCAISNDTVQGKEVLNRLQTAVPWIRSWKKVCNDDDR